MLEKRAKSNNENRASLPEETIWSNYSWNNRGVITKWLCHPYNIKFVSSKAEKFHLHSQASMLNTPTSHYLMPHVKYEIGKISGVSCGSQKSVKNF